MKKKNAFTLIELIAVLVILAVIALIVTPLVLNIVKKAKDSANKRSVDAYGKATELAVATYLLDNGDYPTTIDDLTIEYSGNEVVCNVKTLNEDGSIYLSECTVNGNEVKDAKTDDGWYHYGKLTAGYDTYNIGDLVTYNGMNFYVIANSDENSDYVTLLKAEPLTVNEVNTYGVGHINNYTYSTSVGTAYNYGNYGYGGMAYYSSATCGYPTGATDTSEYVSSGCTTDYDNSDIKYVVDNWSNNIINSSDLAQDNLGYKVRLITYDELMNNLGYNKGQLSGTSYELNPEYTPSWVYSDEYYYWTMSTYEDSNNVVWYIGYEGALSGSEDSYSDYYGIAPMWPSNTVRPVINLLKSAIAS